MAWLMEKRPLKYFERVGHGRQTLGASVLLSHRQIQKDHHQIALGPSAPRQFTMAEKEAVTNNPSEHITPAPQTMHDKTQEGVEATVAEARKNADTVHKDEAMKVLASYDGDLHWTPQEEKVLVRKIDKRLMPILILTYGEYLFVGPLGGMGVLTLVK